MCIRDSIDGSNKTRLNNPEVDALIDKASATIDAAEREKVLQECISLTVSYTHLDVYKRQEYSV